MEEVTAGPPPHLLWINHFAVAPSDGGGTRHFELARELVCRNWRVTIAASDFHLHTRGYTRRPSAAARAAISEQIDGVDFLWLWAAPYERNDWHRARNWLSFQRSLARWRPNGSSPDVIIGSSPHLFAALAGYRMARRLGVPFLFEVRDLWPESLLAAGGSKGPPYYVLGAIARYLYRRADRVIVLARGVAQYLEHHGVAGDKLVYIPNGANTDTFVPRTRSRGPFTLIYAGAHGPANGLDTVLDAAELLADQPFRVILVGDGPSKVELRAKAHRRELTNVEFLDPVPKAEMPALLARADAGLMVLRSAPLFSYGVSPNKLFDYLAAGLPVACNVPGEVAMLLHQSGAVEQARDSSAPALADAIMRIAMRSPRERECMGASGREWVAREHSRSVLGERLDRTLRGVMQQRS